MNLSLKFSDPVFKVRGVGPRYLKYLNKLGIKTIKDLLWHFPFRYEDFSQIKKIKDLQPNEVCSIIATIQKINLYRSFRKRMAIINAKADDDTGTINIIWFNQLYIIKTIPPGTTLSLSGKVKAQGKRLILSNPSYEIISHQKLEEDFFKDLKHTGRLVPIYPETQGLSSRTFRYLIKPLLKNNLELGEYLPSFIIERYKLMPLRQALNQIHFPEKIEYAQQAKNRFIFESLLFSQLYLLKIKEKLDLLPFPKIQLDIDLLKSFVASLPFNLTEPQKKSLWEIAKNLNQRPMNRLLIGEVGSGKTIVAIGASLLTIKSKYQVAVMAPTEILAQQHFNKFKQFLRNYKTRIALLTSTGAKIYDDGLEGKISKRSLNKIINSDLPIIVIGTHALIQKNIHFNKLGLVIVDEQHRFGIEQRKKLLSPNSRTKEIPHLLSLTATPIPRTLALVFYGDMELSILDTLPEGRKKIITQIVTPKNKNKVYEFIRQEILKGRQAFVICPRIEETNLSPLDINAPNLVSLAEKLNYEVKAVKKEYKKLSEEIFPDLKVGMLHGKMKTEEKENIMQQFYDNKINILVSTSVVEVGVDIPNATVMIIEGAEHFGLAQLHQFRGRVGRSHYQSYCFLFTESSSKTISSRLEAVAKYNDGFKLAEIDLSLRGPGEFLGTKQSGVPDLLMHSLLSKEMITQAREAALNILTIDTTFKKWPLFLASFKDFVMQAHRL
ncbi:MAG: ATP-dependent DNA helicase RecG [Parcubacteria group bacterium]|nr:ATP-dependent DNA helicase RecG [Parcubacteria group bacterium]